MKKPRTQKRMSDEAVKARTGKVWAEWFEILDQAGAKKWQHKEISAYLADSHQVGPWWTQMIAVPYEHARRIRQKFQKCDGEFAAAGYPAPKWKSPPPRAINLCGLNGSRARAA